jgi:anthranilate synthase component 1
MTLTAGAVRRPTYTPSLEAVRELTQPGDLIAIYREVRADLETPVSAFLKIARGSYAFLLESVEGGERLARYSFIGTEPYRVAVTRGLGDTDPLELVREEIARHRFVPTPGLPRFHGGAVGYLGYEFVRRLEELPTPEVDALRIPEAVLLFTDTLLVFDHVAHKIKVVSHLRVGGDLEASYEAAVHKIDRLVERLNGGYPPDGEYARMPFPSARRGPVTSNMARERYDEMIARAKEYIAAGDIFQVVLAQRLARPTDAHPFDIYRALRTINPSPYMFYLHLDDLYLIGASPELLVRVEDGVAEYHPIAGSRRRGATAAEDEALERELRADEKERAEHIMLVDLARNDVGRVSRPGSVEVSQLMDVERYSHIMHLVSHVTGDLSPDYTPLDALRACFPAGTVSGAPKIRAMEIIAELEPDRRGTYAGAVGYFSYSGNLDTCITIRTLLLKEGVAYVQAGGGIVADSRADAEFEETLAKARAVLRAIDEAESLSDAERGRNGDAPLDR